MPFYNKEQSNAHKKRTYLRIVLKNSDYENYQIIETNDRFYRVYIYYICLI